MRRIVAIVPAYNEAESIAGVVAELRALEEAPEVVVINDASRDETAAIAREAGATVVDLPFNVGIGATIQTGLRLARSKRYDFVVRVDGDGQHDAADVPRLLEPVLSGRADFVLGSRHLDGAGYQAEPMRRLGIRWFSLLLRTLCGLKSTDPTSGFWASNARAAGLMLDHHSTDYPEVDSLVHLSRLGCRIEEVSVQMRPRSGGESSIGGLGSLYYMIKVTVALVAGRFRRRD